MAIGIDPNEEHKYVLRADRALPEAEQTRWYFGWPTLPDDRVIRNQVTVDPLTRKEYVNYNATFEEAFRRQLRRVENFRVRDKDGNLVALTLELDKNGHVPDAFAIRVAPKDRSELGVFASSLSIKSADRGN